MASNDPETHDLPSDEAAALRAFWSVYSPARERISATLLQAITRMPELASALAALRSEDLAQEERTSAALQEKALLHGEWGPLQQHLRSQGRKYAELGVSFGAWFELIALYRAQMREVLAEVDARDLALATLAREGLNRYMDLSLREIGEAYLETKETLIRRHQEAIRELSTPVLQIRDRLLIIPVVGMVDTQRARQLSEALLKAIRDRRARAVVMDITGVPIVDSRVANHLVQACEAARLMGANVIITGISSNIAQALVTIGAELRGIPTLGDLQTGLEEAERMLARAREPLPLPTGLQTNLPTALPATVTAIAGKGK